MSAGAITLGLDEVPSFAKKEIVSECEADTWGLDPEGMLDRIAGSLLLSNYPTKEVAVKNVAETYEFSEKTVKAVYEAAFRKFG